MHIIQLLRAIANLNLSKNYLIPNQNGQKPQHLCVDFFG